MNKRWIDMTVGVLALGVYMNPDAGAGGGGAPAAAAPAAVDGGNTPGGASVVSDDAGTVNSWEAQALPDGHPGIEKGFKTWGDVDKQYRSSSEEVRRWQQAAEQNAAQAQELQSAVVQMVTNGWQNSGQQPQQQQAPAAKTGFMGFPNHEAYKAAMQADPEGTMDKVMLYRMSNNPEFATAILKMLEPQLGQAIQPVQEKLQQQEQQAYMAQVSSTFEAFTKQNPDYAPGTPGFKVLDNLLRTDAILKSAIQNGNYEQALQFAHAKLEREKLNQINKANEVKLDETRQRAGSARVGGASGQPKGGDLEAQIRANAAEARKNGQNVTEEQIQHAIQQAVRLTAGGKKQTAA